LKLSSVIPTEDVFIRVEESLEFIYCIFKEISPLRHDYMASVEMTTIHMFDNIDRRKLLIGGLVALLVVIIALILLWLFWPKVKTPVVVAPPTQPETASQIFATATSLPPVSAQRVQAENSYPLGLKQLAMAFAERFGSYSTDEPIKNMADLEPFMTANMKNSPDLQTDNGNSGIFSGFSTKALSSDLVSINANSATVTVKTQRTQTLGTDAVAKTFYADLLLAAVKSGNNWMIDAAAWQ